MPASAPDVPDTVTVSPGSADVLSAVKLPEASAAGIKTEIITIKIHISMIFFIFLHNLISFNRNYQAAKIR